MVYCTKTPCSFQTSDKEYYAMHMAIEHSNLHSQSVFGLIQDLVSKLSNGTTTSIEFRLNPKDYRTSTAHPDGIEEAVTAGSAPQITAAKRPISPSRSSRGKDNVKRNQRLIPNSRLNSGNVMSVRSKLN